MFRQNDYESMDSTYSLRFYGIKELRCDLHVMDNVPYIYTIFTRVCLHIIVQLRRITTMFMAVATHRSSLLSTPFEYRRVLTGLNNIFSNQQIFL